MKSTKTVLHQIARPPVGFDVLKAYEELQPAGRVLGLLADRGPSCPLPQVVEELRKDEEKQNALMGAHERTKAKTEMKAQAAAGDLSGFFGQQIAFNQLVSLGALKKNSDGTYTQANGYTMGKWLDGSPSLRVWPGRLIALYSLGRL